MALALYIKVVLVPFLVKYHTFVPLDLNQPKKGSSGL